jgi:hypothetical protein
MTLLNNSNIKEKASKGPYAGKYRKEIIEIKIRDKKPFLIGNAAGTKIICKSANLKTEPIKLYYIDSTKKTIEIPITKIFKDPDFGGGGGSGGGAENTDITESGQAYYCSLIFNFIKRDLKQSDCTDINLQKASTFVTAKIPLKTFLDKGPQSWIDDQIYLKTANKIYGAYRTLFTNAKVFIHQGRGTDAFLKRIYDAKKKVQDLDKKLAQKNNTIPQAPGSFDNDKWNPGDIWLTTLDSSVDPFHDFQNTWSELNNAVLDKAGELKSKNVVLLAVSLKKTGGVVNLTKYNTKVRKINSTIPFNYFTFGNTGDFFSSIDMYFYLGSAKVQFRAFNTTKSWQGEIKGSTAAGGKIGGGNINYYCEKHFKKSIGLNSINSSWQETSPDQVNLKKMYELYKKYNEKQGSPYSKSTFPTLSYNDFEVKTKKEGKGFIFSKNMCLLFLDTFFSGTKNKRDDFATDLIRYGASNTDVSSFFIKVS